MAFPNFTPTSATEKFEIALENARHSRREVAELENDLRNNKLLLERHEWQLAAAIGELRAEFERTQDPKIGAHLAELTP